MVFRSTTESRGATALLAARPTCLIAGGVQRGRGRKPFGWERFASKGEGGVDTLDVSLVGVVARLDVVWADSGETRDAEDADIGGTSSSTTGTTCGFLAAFANAGSFSAVEGGDFIIGLCAGPRKMLGPRSWIALL